MEKKNIIRLTKVVIKHGEEMVKIIDEPNELNKFFEEKITVSYGINCLVGQLECSTDEQICNALKTKGK